MLFNAGTRMTGALMQSVVPLEAVRSSTQSIGNTTLANDDTLFFTVGADFTYTVWATLYYSGGTQGGSDINIAWNTPTSSTWRWSVLGYNTSGVLGLTNQQPAGGQVSRGTNGTGNIIPMWVEGTLEVASTAGTFGLQWAQNSSDGTNTVMNPFSRLIAARIQ